jgi:hypothetical protein
MIYGSLSRFPYIVRDMLRCAVASGTTRQERLASWSRCRSTVQMAPAAPERILSSSMPAISRANLSTATLLNFNIINDLREAVPFSLYSKNMVLGLR